ncbi:MAG: hypothetical protein GY847_05810 [Proteobacteria bacterium]|nr:hypothetical protein [Pseudomonadota bacterium]
MSIALRKKIGRDVFDYTALMAALDQYANPRDKVTSLLKKGVIVRIKKGLYIFASDYRRGPYSKELIANLIYGPSYVSLDYGLAYYGLIPERVDTVTSVTPKRNKQFDTPLGRYTYQSVPEEYFYLGMNWVETSAATPDAEPYSFLIAIPERALADKIRCQRGMPLANQKDVAQYLFDDLRLDLDGFLAMDAGILATLASRSRSRKTALLPALQKNMR